MALSTISGTTGITDATITSAKLADFAAAVDLNGVELILDADQDTSITADTDDRIDFKIANVEHFSFSNSSGDTIVKPMVDAKDIKFQQFDGRTLLDINDGGFVGIENGATGPGAIRIFEDTDNGSNYVGLSVGNVSTAYTLVFPNADGSSGQALTTNGSGVLSFTTLSANTPSSADGQALGSASLEWSDLFLADASTIQFGADQDVTLTHVHNTGLLLNTTMVVQFRDSAINIGSPADGDLDINADDEIELNSTLIDINGNVEISGTLAQVGVATFTARDIHSGGITIANDGQIGSVGDADSMAISSSGVVTFSQNPVATLATAAQANITSLGTLTTLTVDNVITNGSTIGHTDDTDLITVADGLVTVAGEVQMTTLDIGGTNVTATAAELNLLDGGTSVGSSITLADADGFVVNDGGAMKTIPASDIKTYNPGGTAWQSVITGATTMVAGRGYFVNTTSSAYTMTLPSSASIGDTIQIIDYAGTADSNNITIGRNSHKIQGEAANLTVSTERAAFTLVYVDATQGWLLDSK